MGLNKVGEMMSIRPVSDSGGIEEVFECTECGCLSMAAEECLACRLRQEVESDIYRLERGLRALTPAAVIAAPTTPGGGP